MTEKKKIWYCLECYVNGGCKYYESLELMLEKHSVLKSENCKHLICCDEVNDNDPRIKDLVINNR